MLKDRVDLQHQIIKKQDELHEILEKQQREDKVSSVFLLGICWWVGFSCAFRYGRL